jgi:hypothetical protein
MDSARHVIKRNSIPRFCTEMESYDVESTVHQSLPTVMRVSSVRLSTSNTWIAPHDDPAAIAPPPFPHAKLNRRPCQGPSRYCSPHHRMRMP